MRTFTSKEFEERCEEIMELAEKSVVMITNANGKPTLILLPIAEYTRLTKTDPERPE